MGASSPIPSDQSTQTLSVKLLRKAASFTSEGGLIRQGDCFRIPRESMPSAEITSDKPTSMIGLCQEVSLRQGQTTLLVPPTTAFGAHKSTCGLFAVYGPSCFCGSMRNPCLNRVLILRTFCKSSTGLPSSARKFASYPSLSAPIIRFGKIVLAVVSAHSLSKVRLSNVPNP